MKTGYLIKSAKVPMPQINPPEYSIVLSLYNEGENLPELYSQLKSSLNKYDQNYELIFINDGSTDNSLELLLNLQQTDKQIRIIDFYRNFGKSAAWSVGFSLARGKIIITMDADLQDDPGELDRFIAKIKEGYDLVVGWKYPRMDPISKTLPSWFFNTLVNLICGIALHDINCGFKAFRQEIIPHLDIHGGRYRFIPVLANNAGFKVTEIKIHHRPRLHGFSKYGPKRFLEGILDLINISLFRTKPKTKSVKDKPQDDLFLYVKSIIDNNDDGE